MADIETLLQGGAFSLALTALGSLLAYRRAGQQMRHEQVSEHEGHQIEARRVWLEETEQLRNDLLQDLARAKQEFTEYKTEAGRREMLLREQYLEREKWLRKRVEEQDEKIYQLRNQLAQCIEAAGGTIPANRRQHDEGPPGNHERREPLT